MKIEKGTGTPQFTISSELGAFLAVNGILDYSTVIEEVNKNEKSENFAGYINSQFFGKAEFYVDKVVEPLVVEALECPECFQMSGIERGNRFCHSCGVKFNWE